MSHFPGNQSDVLVNNDFAIVYQYISQQTGFVYVTNPQSMKLVLRSLATVTAAGVVLALVTPIGFPYKNHPISPTKQRHVIHVSAELHLILKLKSKKVNRDLLESYF